MKTTSKTMIPHLWYNTEAAEAARFYSSVFPDSTEPTVTTLHNTPSGDADLVSFTLWGHKFMAISAGQEPDREGTIMFADFMLEDTWFAAMDSAHEHDFSFNEAISFMVECDDQQEIDYYWEKLSAVPESEQCGWLKDRFGVSWQIVPSARTLPSASTFASPMD